MKVAKLSALRAGRIYPQEILLVLISISVGVDLWARAKERPEGSSQWKIATTRSWIEPATFRLII